MKTPSKEEIKSAGSSAMTKSHLSSKVYLFDGHSFELGWEQGAEWMEQQLEPLITELGMDRARKAPQSTDVMTLEDFKSLCEDHQLRCSEWGGDVNWAYTNEAIEDIYNHLKNSTKSVQLQAELSEYKSGLKQCQSDRDELHKELEQVKAALRLLVNLSGVFEPAPGMSNLGDQVIEAVKLAEQALQSTKQ